jgi:hypothetical protein
VTCFVFFVTLGVKAVAPTIADSMTSPLFFL